MGSAKVAFISSSIFGMMMNKSKKNQYLFQKKYVSSTFFHQIYRYVEVVPKTVCRSIATSFNVMHHVTGIRKVFLNIKI